MRLLPLVVVLLFASAFIACGSDTTSYRVIRSNVEHGSIISQSLLSDTFPCPKSFYELVGNPSGVSLTFPDGRQVYFFDYAVDSSQILQQFNSLPFKMGNGKSDVTCRQTKLDLPTDDENLLSWIDQDAWIGNDAGYIAYECIKPPFKHTLLVHHDNHKIHHRVERLL